MKTSKTAEEEIIKSSYEGVLNMLKSVGLDSNFFTCVDFNYDRETHIAKFTINSDRVFKKLEEITLAKLRAEI